MKSVFLAVLLFVAIRSFSQVDIVHVFLGKNEQTVTDYFNKLIGMRPNANYQVKRGTTDIGDLDLSVEFSMDDEDYYKCSMLTATFQRKKGLVYCTSQSVFGKIEYANFYVSFLNDKFTKVSDDTWQMPSPVIKGMMIVATYSKIQDHFGIIFDLNEPTK